MSSGQSYGSRRLVTVLANSGLKVGRYKVRQLMQQASLTPVWKRKFVYTTDSKHGLPVAQKVLARQFDPVAPNLAYASDITYIRTGVDTPIYRPNICRKLATSIHWRAYKRLTKTSSCSSGNSPIH